MLMEPVSRGTMPAPLGSTSSARAAGLWDDNANAFNAAAVERRRQQLQADLTKRCAPGLGSSVTVEVHSLDTVAASRYRSWSEWTWDGEPAWTARDLVENG